eukprot:TRINITY_DN11824_c0_g1_i2.p1 TRINITY_DN11824_c0_g1~~TRINITY_DN11824_c0_g1_i2.p1  ORF type:complete len:105 (+),score=32.68 TRINITY_DN11824_c0_g1_i2:98-412(+)
MIRRPPRSTLSSSSAASDVYKRQVVQENLDLFKWLTGQEPVPEDIDSHLFIMLRDHVKAQFENVPVPRNAQEWSSRKWWNEEITDEMRSKMAERDAELQGEPLK